MTTYQTVVPLENLELEPGSEFAFARGLALVPTPGWLQKESMLDDFSKWDRESAQAPFALVAKYEAEALGSPDPDWKGNEAKSIQEAKYELCVLANLALWLRRPCPVNFRVVIHAPEFEGGGPAAQRVSSHSPLLCHPRHTDNRITARDIPPAAALHEGLAAVERDTSVWTAIRATWAALQLNIEAIRYALFWIALEALFGPEDAREMTFRLSQRMALFLFADETGVKEQFRSIKRAYGFRSRIVHGRWKDEPDGLERMIEVEDLVRRSFGRILSGEGLREVFAAKKREEYLDDLVFGAESTKGV